MARFRTATQGRLRRLPPIAGWIPAHALIGAVAATVHRAFEEEQLTRALRHLTGLPHWAYAVSGRAALTVVLEACRERRPDRTEVVIPAYTSYSVPAAVVRAGLTLRLCDVEPATLGLDPAALERAITPRTLCVLAHHLYGLPSKIGVIVDAARRCGVPVIEDAAQGLGIVCGGRPGGASGDVGLFSASRGKTLPGAGGGLIGTQDEDLAGRCRRILAARTPRPGREVYCMVETALMASCIHPAAYWLPASMPFLKLGQSIFDPAFELTRMAGFQQALFRRLLPTEPQLRRCRHDHAVALCRTLGDRLTCLMPSNGDRGGFLRLPVLAATSTLRDRLLRSLSVAGLGATRGYPLALSLLPSLRPWLAATDACPTAEWISERLLTLPTHPWVTDGDREQMRELVRQCT